MKRILVIDDDEVLRRLLLQVLARLGYEAVAEPNGVAGLRRAHEWKPAAVITDIIMPEKEGVETILELKRTLPEIKIVAMSGGGRGTSLDYLQIARRCGADRTLAKPFERDEIRTTLESLLGPPAPVERTSEA